MTAADSLLEAFAPYLADDDGSLVTFLTACASGRELVDELVRDSDAGPGWTALLDVERCPSWGLRWLGQLVGLFIPRGLSDATARDMIRTPQGFRRCTVGAMKAAVAITLTSGDPANVFVLERQSGAWDPSEDWAHFTVATYADDTPDTDLTEAAVAGQTPAWLVASVVQIDHRTLLTIETDFATLADLEAAYSTLADLETGP